MSEAPPIHVALAAVMSDIDHVGKTGTNSHQNYNFRGIDAVLNAVGPALRTHGVVIIPVEVDRTMTVGSTKAGGTTANWTVTVNYSFVGPAGDSLSVVVTGEAMDTGDKGLSKAYSVALRTALIQTLALPTNEPDPDGSTYERGTRSTRPDPEPVVQVSQEVWDQILAVSGRLSKAQQTEWKAAHPMGRDMPADLASKALEYGLALVGAETTQDAVGGESEATGDDLDPERPF